jgi:hypothetical protein
MSDLNIDELIEKFGKNYPDWLNRSLGNQIASMDKTLKQIYGDIDDVEKNVGKLVKNSDKSLAEDKKTRDAIVKVNATLEKISKDKSVTDETKKVKTEISKLGKLLEKANTNDAVIKSEIEKLTKTVEKMNKKDDSSLEKTMKTTLTKLQAILEKVSNAKSSTVDSRVLSASIDKLHKTMEKISNDKKSTADNVALKSEVVKLNATVKKLLIANMDKTFEKAVIDSIDGLKKVLPSGSVGKTVDSDVKTSIDSLTKTIEDFILRSKISSITKSSSSSIDDADEKMEELTSTIEKLTVKNKNLMETLRKRNELDKDYNKSLRNLTNDIKNMGASFSRGDVAGIFGGIGGALEGAVRSAVGLISPSIGNFLGAGLGAATAALVYSVNEIEKSVVAYQRVTAAGYMVEGGLLGLRRAAEAGNISLETMTNLIDQNRRVFLSLGADSARFYGDTLMILRDVNSSFSKFGYTAEQSAEFMSAEMENRRLLGQLQRMDARQAASRMDQELVRLQRLSAAFGVSINDIQTGTRDFLRRGETQTQVAYLEARGVDVSAIEGIRNTLESANMDPQAVEMATQAALRAFAEQHGIAMPFASMQETTAMMGVLVPQTLRLIEALARGEIAQEDFNTQYALTAQQDRMNIGRNFAQALENNDRVSQMIVPFMASFGQIRNIDPSANTQAVQDVVDATTDTALAFGINIRNMGAAALSTISSLFTEAMGSEVVQQHIISNLNIGMVNFTNALNGIDFAAIFGPDGTLNEEIAKFFGTLGINGQFWIDLFTHPDVLTAMALGIAGLWAASKIIGAIVSGIGLAFSTAAAAASAAAAAAMRGLRGVFGGRGTQVPGTRPGPAGTAPRSTTIAPRPQSVPPAGTVPRTPTLPPASPPLRSPAPYGPTTPKPISPWASPAAPGGSPAVPPAGPHTSWLSRIMRNPVVNTGSRIIGPLSFALQGILLAQEWKYYRDNPEALHDMIMEREDENAFRENFNFHGDDVSTPTPNINPTLDTISPFFDQSIGDAEIDDIRRYLESIPEMATGGVAVQKTLAKIAEAGSPEMVLPLDPALHDMAKYIAEQHVEIAGPMYRRLNNELIYRLFRENDEPIDRTFTKSLNKFFFSKEDVENTLRDLQSFYTSDDYLAGRVTELPENIRNALAIMNTMGVRPQDNYSGFSGRTNESGSGYAGTGGGSAGGSGTGGRPAGGSGTGGSGTGGRPGRGLTPEIQAQILEFAERNNINPNALAGVLNIESGFDPSRRGGASNRFHGIFQLQDTQIPGLTQQVFGRRMTPDQYRRLSFSDQLRVYEQYIRNSLRGTDPSDFFTGDADQDASRLWALQLAPSNAATIDYYNPNAAISRTRQADAISASRGLVTVGSVRRGTLERGGLLPTTASGSQQPLSEGIASGHMKFVVENDTPTGRRGGIYGGPRNQRFYSGHSGGYVDYSQGFRPVWNDNPRQSPQTVTDRTAGNPNNAVDGRISISYSIAEVSRPNGSVFYTTRDFVINNNTGTYVRVSVDSARHMASQIGARLATTEEARLIEGATTDQRSFQSAGVPNASNLNDLIGIHDNRLGMPSNTPQSPSASASFAGVNPSDSSLFITPETRAQHPPSANALNISMDFNASPRGNARGTEVIIPDGSGPEVYNAARMFNEEVAAFAQRYGISDYPIRGIRTRSQNGRGVRHTVHTEPFFNTDLEMQRIIQENPQEFAEIYRRAFGGLENARLIAPHGVGADRGATSPIFGDETSYGELMANTLLSGGSQAQPSQRLSFGGVEPASRGRGSPDLSFGPPTQPLQELSRGIGQLEAPMREAVERLVGPMEETARRLEGPMSQIGRQFETMFSGGFPLDFLPNNSNIMGHMSSFASEIQPLLQGAGSTLNNLTQDFGPIVDAVTSSMGRLSRDFRDSASETRLMSRGLIA